MIKSLGNLLIKNLFKICIIIIAAGFLIVYYTSKDNGRYVFDKDGLGVYDTKTGVRYITSEGKWGKLDPVGKRIERFELIDKTPSPKDVSFVLDKPEAKAKSTLEAAYFADLRLLGGYDACLAEKKKAEEKTWKLIGEKLNLPERPEALYDFAENSQTDACREYKKNVEEKAWELLRPKGEKRTLNEFMKVPDKPEVK